MSKLQEREANAFNDIANSAFAEQIDSRLKELERNIAVARQFIKLADEAYIQVRHEWDLMRRDQATPSTERVNTNVPSEPAKRDDSTQGHAAFERTKSKRRRQQPHENQAEEPSSEPDTTAISGAPYRANDDSSNKKNKDTAKEGKGPAITSKNSFLAKSRRKK